MCYVLLLHRGPIVAYADEGGKGSNGVEMTDRSDTPENAQGRKMNSFLALKFTLVFLNNQKVFFSPLAFLPSCPDLS